MDEARKQQILDELVETGRQRLASMPPHWLHQYKLRRMDEGSVSRSLQRAVARSLDGFAVVMFEALPGVQFPCGVETLGKDTVGELAEVTVFGEVREGKLLGLMHLEDFNGQVGVGVPLTAIASAWVSYRRAA